MTQASNKEENLSFWEHLDVLRGYLFKIAVIVVVFAVLAFVFKDILFGIIFAPKNDTFVTYKLFSMITGEFEPFEVKLINTGLAKQFMVHVQTAMAAGVLCASPFILYELFQFVSPALYDNEKKYAYRVVGGGYIMFMLGVLLSYFLIFPLTFKFLGTYQVSESVENMISLDSYISTMLMLCLMMGIVFELPILCWFFAKLGLLTAAFMRRYRRHACVLILVVAAVITPTADAFTMFLVAAPIYVLYEISIFIVARSMKPQTV